MQLLYLEVWYTKKAFSFCDAIHSIFYIDTFYSLIKEAIIGIRYHH